MYHLEKFPAIPEYSKEFYQVIPKEDKSKMVDREYKLLNYKLDAQKLEKMYNK